MEQNHGAQSKVIEQQANHSPDYVSYPKIDPLDVIPPAETWSAAPMSFPSGNLPVKQPVSLENPISSATTMPADSNPYVSSSPVPPSPSKNTVESMKDMLGKLGKKAVESTKKMEDFAGGMWQHLRTSPSFTDAAVGRIAQGTKALAEGGYEKIFQQTFETVPSETLRKSYACYLSTSAGPVMGILYLSTEKLAFCSDNPLSYKAEETTQWSYYKVVIPLNQIKAANPSKSKANPWEKFVQIMSVDNHEFWFLGFVNYDSAVKNLLGILQQRAR